MGRVTVNKCAHSVAPEDNCAHIPPEHDNRVLYSLVPYGVPICVKIGGIYIWSAPYINGVLQII